MKVFHIWLWPCSIREEFCVIDVLFVLIMHVYVCLVYFYVVLYFSSPYLLVFGDDRVLGTCEQVMMQVELVRPSSGEGIVWEIYMFLVSNNL